MYAKKKLFGSFFPVPEVILFFEGETPSEKSMSVRQRLQARLQSRKSNSICWSCSFGIQRHLPKVQQAGFREKRYNNNPSRDPLADTDRNYQQRKRSDALTARTHLTHGIPSRRLHIVHKIEPNSPERPIRFTQPMQAPKAFHSRPQISCIQHRKGTTFTTVDIGPASANIVPSSVRTLSFTAHQHQVLRHGPGANGKHVGDLQLRQISNTRLTVESSGSSAIRWNPYTKGRTRSSYATAAVSQQDPGLGLC